MKTNFLTVLLFFMFWHIGWGQEKCLHFELILTSGIGATRVDNRSLGQGDIQGLHCRLVFENCGTSPIYFPDSLKIGADDDDNDVYFKIVKENEFSDFCYSVSEDRAKIAASISKTILPPQKTASTKEIWGSYFANLPPGSYKISAIFRSKIDDLFTHLSENKNKQLLKKVAKFNHSDKSGYFMQYSSNTIHLTVFPETFYILKKD